MKILNKKTQYGAISKAVSMLIPKQSKIEVQYIIYVALRSITLFSIIINSKISIMTYMQADRRSFFS